MSTIDLSRQATDFRKHYDGVRMQQGRVLTDDDFNEASLLQAEEQRRARIHTIGAYGAPDAGFLPKSLTTVSGKPTFTLSAGNLYLGGLRLELNEDQTFHLQKNWLNFDSSSDWPSAPSSGQKRTDLIWIEAWQQPVTAIEDEELFEVALSGADTSVRLRTMYRVHVLTGATSKECAAAWNSVLATPGFSALGSVNSDMEISTNAKLKVGYSAPTAINDLCSPSTAGGYLGAENQAIRVQMVSPTTYTWGYNNASPLYRVQVSAKSGQLIKVKLLTEPKDAVHWPLQNQVVEILPWSAALVNGERVADISGHLSNVSVSYNPDDKTFELSTPLPPTFGNQWKTRSDKNDFYDGTAGQDFFYLRVWDRGDDLSSPAEIPIATSNLGNTGLTVAFNGDPLRAGDYWIISARPSAPDAVVPWELESANGRAPHGIKRYRAPLALIEWQSPVGGPATGTLIHDCRPSFLPLSKLKHCCSVTVGDGDESFGQFSSIMSAIAALPASGGTVCILPGTYEESISLDNKYNITLHGCGPRSRVIAQQTNGSDQPAIKLTKCRDIAIEELALEGGTSAVIHVELSAAVQIQNNLIQMRDVAGTTSVWPAVYAECKSLEITGNIIEILPQPVPADHLERIFQHSAAAHRLTQANTARGGIQIAGRSEQVNIVDNTITGGIGNGITLGSLIKIDQQNPLGEPVADIALIGICAPCQPTDSTTPTNPGSSDPTYKSAGALYNIHIAHNHILAHGANGIGVVRFFGKDNKNVELIAVHGLSIHHNTIMFCLRRSVGNVSNALRYFVGYGGIALALTSELDIQDNDILANGKDWQTPVCGIFALIADGLRIERNRILHNGPSNQEPIANAQQGLRAGVHIWMASTFSSNWSQAMAGAMHSHQKLPLLPGGEQIRVDDNQIEQPLGRALFLLGVGPMTITGNRLSSHGAGAPATDAIANTVLVGNFGFSREWTWGLVMTLIYKLVTLKNPNQYGDFICTLSNWSRFMPGIELPRPPGKVLFQHNQVAFHQPAGVFGFDIASTLLLSLDDISAGNNQFEHHSQLRIEFANLVALGLTLRVNDNRFAETWGRAIVSGISLGLMNTTTNNQSTHCLWAEGLSTAVHYNLTLAELFCKNACGDDFLKFFFNAYRAAMVKNG